MFTPQSFADDPVATTLIGHFRFGTHRTYRFFVTLPAPRQDVEITLEEAFIDPAKPEVSELPPELRRTARPRQSEEAVPATNGPPR